MSQMSKEQKLSKFKEMVKARKRKQLAKKRKEVLSKMKMGQSLSMALGLETERSIK